MGNPDYTRTIGSTVRTTAAIVPNDAVDLASVTTAIYVGGAGALKVDTVDGGTVTLNNLAVGVWHPIQATRVYATGTTATTIIGAY